MFGALGRIRCDLYTCITRGVICCVFSDVLHGPHVLVRPGLGDRGQSRGGGLGWTVSTSSSHFSIQESAGMFEMLLVTRLISGYGTT